MPPIDFGRRTALYRLLDTEGVLLYVGIAFDPEERWRYHGGSAAWWPDVARKDVQWLDSRILALEAEGHAIEDERPLYNIRGAQHPVVLPRVIKPAVTPNRMVRVGADWDAYGRACEAKGISRSDDLRMHIKAEITAFERGQRRATRVEPATSPTEADLLRALYERPELLAIVRSAAGL